MTVAEWQTELLDTSCMETKTIDLIKFIQRLSEGIDCESNSQYHRKHKESSLGNIHVHADIILGL